MCASGLDELFPQIPHAAKALADRERDDQLDALASSWEWICLFSCV
jgi:hypothetical protein